MSKNSYQKGNSLLSKDFLKYFRTLKLYPIQFLIVIMHTLVSTEMYAIDYFGKNGFDPSLVNSWSSTGSGQPTGFMNPTDNFIIQSGTTMTLAANWTVGAKVTCNGTLNAGSYTLNFSNSFTVSGIFNAGTGTVNFNGTGAQTIPATNYYNLTISVYRTADSITLAPGIIGISGTFSPLATFKKGAYITRGNTINFNGTTQTIPMFPYYDMIISKSGTKTLTLTSSININLLIVNVGSTLKLNDIRNYSLTTSYAIIKGTLINRTTFNTAEGGIFKFFNGSAFELDTVTANIPTATWEKNSTCKFTAAITERNYSSLKLEYFHQDFGNFIWTPKKQETYLTLKANLTHVQGNFIVENTGTGSFSLGTSNQGSGDTLDVDKDFIHKGGYLYFVEKGGVGSDVQSGFKGRKVKISGSFKMLGGTIDLCNLKDGGVEVQTYVGDSCILKNCKLMSSGTSTKNTFFFTSSSKDHIFYSLNDTIQNHVNFTVNNEATLCMNTCENPSVIKGSLGKFTLMPGSWLKVTSPNGITKTDTTLTGGNIRVKGERNYYQGSVHYWGDSTNSSIDYPQLTGDGLSSVYPETGAVNVIIDNPVAIKFTDTINVSNNINIISTNAVCNLNFGYVHTASTLNLGEWFFDTSTFGPWGSPAENRYATEFFNQVDNGSSITGIIKLKDPCEIKTKNTCVWIGDVSTDWHDPLNWCTRDDNNQYINQIPTRSLDAVIQPSKSDYQPVIETSEIAECRNITIYPGSTLKIKGINKLNVYEDFINHGIDSILTNGYITLNDTNSQFVNHGIFAAVSGTIQLNGIFRNESGNFYGNTGTLILSKTAPIKEVEDGNDSRFIFNNNGIFEPGTGNVVFNANGEQSIGGRNNSYFYNLSAKGSGTKILTYATAVSEALTIDSIVSVALSSKPEFSPSLIVNKLVFNKTIRNTAEFYRNNRSVDIRGIIRTKVKFERTGEWHFVSFPYDIKSVKKSDGTTVANGLGVDFSLGQYNSQTRANNKSAWETSTDAFPKKDKGYIISRKSDSGFTDIDLYFESDLININKDTVIIPEMFNDSRTYNLTYTTGSPYFPSNFGWNLIAHPLSVTGSIVLSNGQFAYGYQPSKDYYKIYYGINNPGYTYQAEGIKPFTTYFLKTNSANATDLLYTSNLTERQGMPAFKATAVKSDETFVLGLNVDNTDYSTIIRIKEDATSGYDILYDASYLAPMLTTTPQIYSIIGSNQYALNSIPENSIVSIGIKVPFSGTYTFNWNPTVISIPVSLTDKVTGVTIDMNRTDNYTFTTTSGDINSRFILNIYQKVYTETINGMYNEIRIISREKSIQVEKLNENTKISVYEISGKLLNMQIYPPGTATLNVPETGLYLLELTNTQNTIKTKVICK